MPYRRLLFLLTALFCCCTARAESLPSSFDLRNIDGHSFIGPVKNQGRCGSCWSFGTLAAAESSLNRANGWHDDQAIELSEAFLVWSLSPLSDHDGMAGCNGGNLDDPMTAMLEYGAPLQAEFPYLLDNAQNVIDPGQNLHWDAPRYTLEDWHTIPYNDIETTRRVLHSVGAVSIAAYAGRDAWHFYQEGVFEDDLRAPTAAAFVTMDHAISLIGWDDEPEDGGMGAWILRNSWDDNWGEEGYMRIRYLSSWSNLEGHYLIAEPWNGENSDIVNSGHLAATAWSAGGTLNAHGVDLWGAAASSVTNHGEILAQAASTEELVTARGVYLWGGPAGFVDNAGDVKASAYSQNNQAIAYGVNLQGGSIDNRGVMIAAADSGSDLAMAYGIWAANGKNELKIVNSGDILARTGDGSLKIATGVFSDNRELTVIDNQGSISAVSGGAAAGILFARGTGLLVNNGDILAEASSETSEFWFRGGWGVKGESSTRIINSGTIGGSSGSIYSRSSSQVTLTTGSDLIGPVYLLGSDDTLQLTGTGTEDEIFYNVEHLVMDGLDWSLSGDSGFDSIDLSQGRLSIDGALAGQTRVHADGMLGGSGNLTGNVINYGVVAPGHSVGHLTIDGDFEQTANAALVIEIGNQEADLLTVTGSADLAGSLVVLPDGYASAGHYTFLEAGALAGQFDRLQSVAVLDTELLETPSALTLEITRNSYASLATPPSRGLAANLDSVRAAATGDFGDLLDQLDLAADEAILNADLAAMTPRIHGFAGAAVLADSQSRLSDLRRHLGSPTSRAGKAQETKHRMTAWIDLPAGYTRYHSGSAYPAATEKLYGLMLGIEREASGGITAGLAVAITESDYRFRDTGDDGESQSQQGYLYGRWRNPERWGSFQLDAAIGVGRTELTAQRDIAFAGRVARSEHDGRSYSASLRGRLSLPLDNWRFSPALGISCVRLEEDGFRETGADSADLEIRSRQGDSVQSLLGFDLEHPLTVAGVSMNPALQLEWRHEFETSGAPLHSKLRSGDESFTSPGRDLADDTLLLGATLRTEISPSTYAAVSYDLLLQSGDNATGHALALQLGMIF